MKLVGITYNQVESGVYALILQEEEGDRRLPIIIGYPEAQSIECRLQEVKTPRPLTHDLFLNTLGEFGIDLREVWIHQLPNGVFAADLTFESPRGEIRIVDSRSSDAIALAIRCDAIIYTSEALLQEAGITPGKDRKESRESREPEKETQSRKKDYAAVSDDGLKKLLAKAVENENYEEAGEIKKELDRRK